MLEMVIYGVSFDMVGKQPIVLLKTLAGNRFLPIWIGHPEAAAILMRLQDARPPRPATHDLMCNALEELGAEVTQVAITDLRDNTFFAQVTVSNGIDEHELDSRPSDALALAVRAEAPIFAAEQIVMDSGIEFEQDAIGDTDEMVEKFRTFLDDVTPDDFA
ncbi:MAG: bifunctional nuclease family protein [Thermoleophilia bacterium]|nr:bifunctional nuclease family protein [Thermoleophilia bacterium]